MSQSTVLLAVQLGCTAAVGGYLAVQLFQQRGWRWLAAALLLPALGAAGALAGYGCFHCRWCASLPFCWCIWETAWAATASRSGLPLCLFWCRSDFAVKPKQDSRTG